MGPALPESFFRDVVEQMPEAVVFSDRDGIIQFWNRGAEIIFGWSAGEAIGGTLDLIVPDRWRARHWEGYRTVMETGVTAYGDRLLAVPAQRKDGTAISIEFSIALLRDGNGRVGGALAVVRDVSARRQDEQALRKRLAALEERQTPPAPPRGT